MIQEEAAFALADIEAARQDLRVPADSDPEDLQTPKMKRRYTGERVLSTIEDGKAGSTDTVESIRSESEVRVEVAECLV